MPSLQQQKNFDVLIIDDRGSWIELIIEAWKWLPSSSNYTYDTATTCEFALEKIYAGDYKTVLMNVNFESTYKGRNILTILNDKNIPVVLMSGYTIAQLTNLQERYHNVKDIIGKGPDPEDHDVVVSRLIRIIPKLITEGALTHKTFIDTKGGENMIIELLTTETIKAVVKFLASQAEKFADRVNTDQLAQIEQKAEAAKTEEEVCAVQILIKEAIPDIENIASLKAFAEWVEDQIDQDFNELLGVGELTFKVVRELRKQEENLMKKDNLKDMEKLVKIELESFKKQLTQRTVTIEDKANLYDRITNTLENICK